MAKLEFQDLRFEDGEEKVKVSFLKNFYFEILRAALEAIDQFAVRDNEIIFANISEKRALNKFRLVLDKALTGIKSKVTGKKAVFVHRNSGIPLIGTPYFGIIDRNTNLLEVRPVAGCNLNCIYCSVDEGISTRKNTDFVVEKEYILEEVEKLVKYKGTETDVQINSQGEPTLYYDLPGLVRGLKALGVRHVSMITNGTLLDRKAIDELAAAGLDRINLSLNAIDRVTAIKVAGCRYEIGQIKDIAGYIASKMRLLIAPVLVPGINDGEMIKLVRFSQGLGAEIGIQNFLEYKMGRNIVEQKPWEEFYAMLSKIEAETGAKLVKSEADFGIVKTRPLEKPFKKGQTIKAEVMCYGRYNNERIGAARGRALILTNCSDEIGKTATAKVLRDKHNLFIARAV